MIRVGHLGPAVEMLDLAADGAARADRQLLRHIVRLGIEEDDIQRAALVLGQHPVGLLAAASRPVLDHGDDQGGNHIVRRLGDPGIEAPVDDPARQMPEQIHDRFPGQRLQQFRDTRTDAGKAGGIGKQGIENFRSQITRRCY